MILPDKWTVKPLSEVVTIQRGFDLPHQARRLGPFPVLTAGETGGFHDEGPIKGPGVTIGRATNLGKPKWSDGDFWPHNTTMYVKDFKGNLPKWVFHLFENTDLTGFDSGSVQPMLNRNYIAQVPVITPPLPEQQAIAEVLGALDDKIAANTKLAATAAQLTQSLFSRAVKESSDEYVLSEITELLSRGVTPKYSEDADTMMILNQKCVRGQRVELEPARRTLLSKVREDKVLKTNDVLVNSTGQGTLGRVARWIDNERSTVDSHITIVRFNAAKVHPVTAGIGLLGLQETIIEMGEGSTGQTELSRVELGKLRVRLPRIDVQVELGRHFDDLAKMEQAHLAENGTLAATRDALLPSLMSGKLRVKDVEALVSSAV